MWAFSECAASQRRLQQRLLHTPDRNSTPAERRTSSSHKQPLHSAGGTSDSEGSSSSRNQSSSSHNLLLGDVASQRVSPQARPNISIDSEQVAPYVDLWGELDAEPDPGYCEPDLGHLDALHHLDLDPVVVFRCSALASYKNPLAVNLERYHPPSSDSITELDLMSPDASAGVADISLPSDAWIQALCDSLEGRLNELQPQNHAIILTGCMSLDFVPQPDWISSCLRHATTPPLPPGPRVLDMRPRNLLAILSAVAAWQHKPAEDVVERFVMLLRQLRPVMTDEDVQKLEGMSPVLQVLMPGLAL